ncbi:MAG: hypothetical protein R3B09_07790 [Nannocystaceae bacterium]
MVRRGHAVVLALSVVTIGCTDGDAGASTSAGSASASTGTSTTAATAQSASEGSTGTSTTATGGASTTQASTTQATTTQGSTTTPVTTTSTSSTTSTTEVLTTDATTTSDTTGGAGACADLGAVDFGDCDAIVGWIFDGEACALRSGCGCEPHCEGVYESAQACALGCAATGACATAKMKAAGIAADPFVVGSFCDGVYLCGGDEADLLALFPGQPWEAKAGYPCESEPMCTAYYQGIVDAPRWEQLCAASLLPAVNAINCTVWGP